MLGFENNFKHVYCEYLDRGYFSGHEADPPPKQIVLTCLDRSTGDLFLRNSFEGQNGKWKSVHTNPIWLTNPRWQPEKPKWLPDIYEVGPNKVSSKVVSNRM